jgi:hypothetical protein
MPSVRTAIAAGAAAAALAAAVYSILRWVGDDVGLVAIRDVLIDRDGGLHEGRLEHCVSASCRLGDRDFERDAIAFIGRQWLVAKGVDASRITASGAGESRPVSQGSSEAEHQKNRRVEIRIKS